GADGIVHFPAFKGLDREKWPQLYVVKKDTDLSFLPVAGRETAQKLLDETLPSNTLMARWKDSENK
uniref:hypothetical protein n=1 Tax=Klebsiella pneumoniae TaxID=573 RepID=UPI001E3EF79F